MPALLASNVTIPDIISSGWPLVVAAIVGVLFYLNRGPARVKFQSEFIQELKDKVELLDKEVRELKQLHKDEVELRVRAEKDAAVWESRYQELTQTGVSKELGSQIIHTMEEVRTVLKELSTAHVRQTEILRVFTDLSAMNPGGLSIPSGIDSEHKQ